MLFAYERPLYANTGRPRQGAFEASWTWVVAYHCDVRSLTGEKATFDRPQPDAGCNGRKGFDPSRPLR
jgi:hypothetical protein